MAKRGRKEIGIYLGRTSGVIAQIHADPSSPANLQTQHLRRSLQPLLPEQFSLQSIQKFQDTSLALQDNLPSNHVSQVAVNINF